MAVIAPTPVDALPTAPDPNDRATFDARAYPFQVALSGAYRTQMNALASNVNNNAGEAVTAASTATEQAVAASAAASVALGAANFKGEWSTLTGPLNTPASVRHSGRNWLLLSNLADVTAAVPGVSASWAPLDGGVVPSAYITSNTTVVPGIRYIIGAAGITLDMTGVTWLKGDYFGVREAIGTGTYTLNFGTTKDRTRTIGSVVLTANFLAYDRTYEDTTRGLI